jgi:sec-independent protein translocase protein TatB
MNVFGVGPMEMALVAVIAVVVLGPQRFPEFAVQIARAIKYLRGYANDATSELRAEFQELTREYEDMRKELDEVRSSVAKDAGSVSSEIASAGGELRRVATETRPQLRMPRLSDTKPIIEPGGDLPPDRNGTSGSGC